MPATQHRSVCPYDCPDTCGLLVSVENGMAVKVSGDPQHPFTRGTLCPKMNRYADTVHSPRRLTRPLERSGPKGSGEFREIAWEAAVDTISRRWQEIISGPGAEAILPYSYAGTMGAGAAQCRPPLLSSPGGLPAEKHPQSTGRGSTFYDNRVEVRAAGASI